MRGCSGIGEKGLVAQTFRVGIPARRVITATEQDQGAALMGGGVRGVDGQSAVVLVQGSIIRASVEE